MRWQTWKHIRDWCLLGCVLSLTACGSATQGTTDTSVSSGDSDTVTVTGSVGSSSTTGKAVSSDTSSSCAADTVVATDTSGAETEASVASDCEFELTLQPDHNYTIVLFLSGTYVATLQFDSGAEGFPTTLLPAQRGVLILALGRISISGPVATPTNEPLDETDADDDGESDLADTDDDNDSIDDEEEADCDEDGLVDDLDDDTTCTGNDPSFGGRILALRPIPHAICRLLNEVGIELRFCHRAPLKVPVTAWVSCRVDQSTVNSETFRVEADGHAVECHYRVKRWKGEKLAKHSGRKNHHLIRCWHRADPFESNTVYTATIEGVQCHNGELVKPRSWSFLTIDTPRRDFDLDDEVDSCGGFEEDEEVANDTDTQ